MIRELENLSFEELKTLLESTPDANNIYTIFEVMARKYDRELKGYLREYEKQNNIAFGKPFKSNRKRNH